MSLFGTLIPSMSRAPSDDRANDRQNATPAVKPRYEIKETPDAYGVTVQLPGVAKDGLNLTAEDNRLTIRGERAWKRPAGWTALYRESTDLPFELVLQYDNAIDSEKIHAELRDGVLRVSLPKTEARKPRKIAIA